MKSIVFTCVEMPESDGFVQLTDDDLPIPANALYPARIAVLAAPGVAVPANAIEVVTNLATYEYAPYLLVRDGITADGDNYRAKMIRPIPNGLVVTATNVFPQGFAGDE